MFKKSYFVISLWVVLGSLSGLFFSSFYGKTDLYIPFYHDISNVLERTSPSVVNIWTIKKWRGWQEQSNEFGFKFNRRVIKTGFFPNGSGVVIDKDIIEKEQELVTEELKNSGKPEDIAKKISLGKMNKFKEENALLTQAWVMEPKKKVKDIIKELAINDLKIKEFSRIKIGE